MTRTDKAIKKFVKKFPPEMRGDLMERIKALLQAKPVVPMDDKVQALPAAPKGGRLTEMLDTIDKFLSNHDGTYKEDARALWHIIGGATRGPDDEDGACKSATVNLRGIAFPRTAKLGTGTGAAFTFNPTIPTIPAHGLGHFKQHAQKALDGLRRAGRIKAGKLVPFTEMETA